MKKKPLKFTKRQRETASLFLYDVRVLLGPDETEAPMVKCKKGGKGGK